MAAQLPQPGHLGRTGQGGLRDPGHVPPRPRLPRASLLVGDQPRRLCRHRPHGHADGRRDHPSGIELGSLRPGQHAPHARVPHGCAQSDLHAADPALGLRTGRRLHEREGRRDQEGRVGEEGPPDGAAGRAERVEIRALYSSRDSAGYRQARVHASPGSGVHPPHGLHRPDGHPRRRVRVRHQVVPPRRHVQGRPGDHGRAHPPPWHFDRLHRHELRRHHRPVRGGGVVDRRGEARHQQGLLGVHPAQCPARPHGRSQRQPSRCSS